ncbi:MAG: 2'-5' RNA ligase family protein [Spirochaetaceae bacterium]|jgi:2'-5' RNA ligase|nr:2'-5' RNA ligase family protein [Spirochaetaceae bacterium]
MEYAIVLYFNEDEDQYMTNIIKNIADESNNGYMTENHIPPHLTLALFNSEINEKEIIETLDKTTNEYTKENIKISSIGIFNPAVIYLSPILNGRLIEINIRTNNILKQININNNTYLFNQWVPHISLAVKLNIEQLKKALNVTIKRFKPFDCKINSLALVKCNPYKEIKIWKIK